MIKRVLSLLMAIVIVTSSLSGMTAKAAAGDLEAAEAVEAEYACTQSVFKAKVVNKDGEPAAGVIFESVIDGNVDTTITSDANGIITYQVYGQNNKKVTYIRLADERYTTADEHYFEASGAYDSTTFITTIDGQSYEEGTKLTYTVTEAGEETPTPEVNQTLVLNTISIKTEDIKAPGEVEMKIQLAEENSSVLTRLRLVFRGETNPDRFLYYWVEAEDIKALETEGEYSCTFELAENVVADTYVLNEIELCNQEDQRRNYALDSELGLLKDWTDGYEIELLKMNVVEGCKDKDFDAPLLQNLSYDKIVYTGETLEVSVTATDASGVGNASIVFYNSYMEQYLYLDSCKMTDLGNGKYKFQFEIHQYQYADSYVLESITLTDASMHHNSTSYWVDGSYLKNIDGKKISISNDYKYLTIAQKDNILWATTYTSDLYPVVTEAKENGVVAVIGGDSDGSQWILDKRVLNAAKLKKLTLILADILTDTEIVIDASGIPSELPAETYAGLEISEFKDGRYDLKLQMTSPELPFTVKFKTKELKNLQDKAFSLYEVSEDGISNLVEEMLVVDKDGYLKLNYLSGIDSEAEWSHFQLVRSEISACEKEHIWGESILTKAATIKSDGQKDSACQRCGTVKRNSIPSIDAVTLNVTKYIYNGTIRNPGVTVKDAKGKKLVKGTDYKISYASGRKKVGRYAVKVIFKGNYSGTSTKYFTIVPKAVTNFKAIRYQYGNKVRLSWTKSTGATGYRIYRKKANATNYTYLGATKNAYYINSGLTKNTSYRYKVIPYYKTSSGTTQYYSTNAYKTFLINTVKKGNKLSQVTKVKAAKNGTKVKVSWKNVNYETGYQISRSAIKTGTNIVATFKTTTGTSKVINATKNKAYYYKVRAYRVVNGKKIFGAWSGTVKFTRK